MELASATQKFSAHGHKAFERLHAITQQLARLQRAAPQMPIGLAMQAEGIALASVARAPGSLPRLTRCEFHRTLSESAPGVVLRDLSSQTELEGCSFRLVLNPDEYQLHLVESPEVPAAELREALRWRVRDLLDFPVEQAAIDAFDLPPQAGRAKTRNLCVVAARSELIARKAALASRGGGTLDLIDIPELALRNLLAQSGLDAHGIALLYAEPGQSLIMICADGALYLSRRVNVGLHGLAHGGEEALAMELLRSLEYYETHFSRPPVESLLMAPAASIPGKVQQHFEKVLGLRVRELDLNMLFEAPVRLPPELQARTLLAIGAALRQDRPSL